MEEIWLHSHFIHSARLIWSSELTKAQAKKQRNNKCVCSFSTYPCSLGKPDCLPHLSCLLQAVGFFGFQVTVPLGLWFENTVNILGNLTSRHFLFAFQRSLSQFGQVSKHPSCKPCASKEG